MAAASPFGPLPTTTARSVITPARASASSSIRASDTRLRALTSHCSGGNSASGFCTPVGFSV